MKKRVSKIFCLAIVLCIMSSMLTSLPVFASTAGIDNGFKWSDNGTSVTITGYSGSSKNITIPSEINGNPVTAIGYQAFCGSSSLESITIPNSVLTIGKEAFRDCSSLTSMNFPKTITSIGDNVFYGCTSLASSNWPSGTPSISPAAFINCTGLKQMNIPEGVTEIGDDAFLGCTSLTNVTIPNTVTYLGNEAFRGCTGLTNFVLPSSVTIVAGYAFADCSSLQNVTFLCTSHSGTIGGSAFSGCASGFTVTGYANSYADAITEVLNVPFVIYSPDTVFSIIIKSLPMKTKYAQGQTLDLAGAAITVTFIDNTTRDVSVTEKMISGYDPNVVGMQKVTVSYQEKKATFSVTVSGVVSISMKSNPAQTSIKQGQSLDLNGAVITVALSDNTTMDMNISADMISGYDPNKAGTQTVTVTFQSKKTTFTVTVIGISSIAFKSAPAKTTYIQGQSLDLTSAVLTASYSDATSQDISVAASMVSGFDPNLTGTQTVTVTYQGKTVTFSVTVQARIIVSITLKTSPAKTVYGQGQSLDLNGASITATYNDGTKQIIPVTKGMVSGYNPKKLKSQTVTVTYQGKTTRFSVTVVKASASKIVTFHSNGGSAVLKISVITKTKINAPTEPTKKGFVFQGWYTAKSGGKKVAFPYTVTKNTTLYAHWK